MHLGYHRQGREEMAFSASVTEIFTLSAAVDFSLVLVDIKSTFLFSNKSSVVGEQQIGFWFSSAIQASSVSQIHENLNPVKPVRCTLCFIENDEAHKKNEILIESMVTDSGYKLFWQGKQMDL